MSLIILKSNVVVEECNCDHYAYGSEKCEFHVTLDNFLKTINEHILRGYLPQGGMTALKFEKVIYRNSSRYEHERRYPVAQFIQSMKNP